jgi:hypothetical protein
MVPAAAVIPSLIAFSYVVAVKKLVAFSSLKRVTLRKSECSNQGHCCTLQQRTTCPYSDVRNGVYGSAGLIVFVGDR